MNMTRFILMLKYLSTKHDNKNTKLHFKIEKQVLRHDPKSPNDSG